MAKSNVTAVQVPGEAPAQPNTDLIAEQSAEQSSEAPESATNEIQSEDAPAVDIEALRAQIRAEEQAKARTELMSQAQVALKVASVKPATTVAAARGSYRTMSADDIDAASLTAPVMTKDGWLCPPPPTEKK